MNLDLKVRRRDLLLAGAYALLGASCKSFQPKTRPGSDVYQAEADSQKGDAPTDTGDAGNDGDEEQNQQKLTLDELIERNKRQWPRQEVTLLGKKNVLDVSAWSSPGVTIGTQVIIPGITDRYEGKGLLISVGASWCAPCLQEISHLTYFYQDPAYKEMRKYLEVVYVVLETNEENVRKLVEPLPFPTADIATKKFGAETFDGLARYISKTRALPFNMIIDQEQRLVWATPFLLDSIVEDGEARQGFNDHVWTCLATIASHGQRMKENKREENKKEMYQRRSYALSMPVAPLLGSGR